MRRAPGSGERKELDQAFSEQTEVGECLAQPTSHDKRNLLTRSPCSGKELFRDLPAASQSRSWGAGELGYFRGSAESSPNSSILAPGSAFVPWALRGQVALVGLVLAPPGQAAATWAHHSTILPTPWKPPSQAKMVNEDSKTLGLPFPAATLSS